MVKSTIPVTIGIATTIKSNQSKPALPTCRNLASIHFRFIINWATLVLDTQGIQRRLKFCFRRASNLWRFPSPKVGPFPRLVMDIEGWSGRAWHTRYYTPTALIRVAAKRQPEPCRSEKWINDSTEYLALLISYPSDTLSPETAGR